MFLPLIVLQCGILQIKKFLVAVTVLAEEVYCVLGEECYVYVVQGSELRMNFFSIWQSLEHKRVPLFQQQQMVRQLSNSAAAASH